MVKICKAVLTGASSGRIREHTIDCYRFEREPAATPARTMSVSTPAALLDAVEMIRAILREAAAALPGD